MPRYEYEDQETGVRVELSRSVEDRNKPIVLQRTRNIPDRISIHGLEPCEAEEFDNKILKAFHKKEEKEGSRFQCGEFTKAQIKAAWTDPIREVRPLVQTEE